MITDNKYMETGSNPYYLNLNGTAKDLSFNENTNPQDGFLSIISKDVLIIQEIGTNFSPANNLTSKI